MNETTHFFQFSLKHQNIFTSNLYCNFTFVIKLAFITEIFKVSICVYTLTYTLDKCTKPRRLRECILHSKMFAIHWLLVAALRACSLSITRAVAALTEHCPVRSSYRAAHAPMMALTLLIDPRTTTDCLVPLSGKHNVFKGDNGFCSERIVTPTP